MNENKNKHRAPLMIIISVIFLLKKKLLSEFCAEAVAEIAKKITERKRILFLFRLGLKI